MNEQKRKILNIALIIINVILVVAIARVSILLYYEVEPNDYQTIICKYRKNKFCINSELFFNYSKEDYITESINKLYYYLNDKLNIEEEINNNIKNLKEGDNIEITIKSIEDEYILGKDEDNNDIYICSNLYDFSYKHCEYNLCIASVI